MNKKSHFLTFLILSSFLITDMINQQNNLFLKIKTVTL